MSTNKTLLDSENKWVTSMGGTVPGEKVKLRGKDLLNDFQGKSWMHTLMHGITGRLFNHKQCELFEAIWSISTSYPEPRVWNNRVSSLAATTRSTGNLGIAAGLAVSEASIYGQGPMVWVMSFLQRAEEKTSNGQSVEKVINDELNKYNRIFGFGRPIVDSDERILPLMKEASRLGLADGKYMQLLGEVRTNLQRGPRKLEMNVAALDAALCADQGLNVREFYYFMSLCFSAGLIFCNVDSMVHEEGAFFPLRCERISYSGADNRKW